MTSKVWKLALAAVVVTVLAAAFSGSLLPQPAAAQATRTIYMAAVEPKGGTGVSSEAFPTAALPAGGGYILKAPDATGRWEVSTYQWQPGFVVARQGERVTLEIIGINGEEHVSSLPPYVQSFTVKRGQVTRVTFTADRAGLFPILCAIHQPSMTGYLVVLPK